MLEDVLLIWPLNHDANSSKLIELCNEHGVSFEWLSTISPTIVKRRIYTDDTYMFRSDNDHKQPGDKTKPVIIESHVKHTVKEILDKHKNLQYIVVSDYNKWTIDQELVDILKQYSDEHEVKLLVDTKPQNADMFRGVYVLKPNFTEFTQMIGKNIANDDDLVAQSWKDFVKNYHTNLVVTRWEQWATVITKEGEVMHLHTHATSVVDVTWAWDTFLAGLTAALEQWMNLKEAVEYGNKASWIAVMKSWTTVVTKKDMEQSS